MCDLRCVHWLCQRTQGVDYLKYDNCDNGDLKPLERSDSDSHMPSFPEPLPCPSEHLLDRWQWHHHIGM